MAKWGLICGLLLAGGAGLAQEFTGLARVNPESSRVEDTRRGVQLRLSLSQGVPYRVFTLDAPRRLVMDFQEVDWTGLSPDAFDQSERVLAVQAGTYVPGLSRMVLALSDPLDVVEAGVVVDAVTAQADLQVILAPVSAESFAGAAGAPYDPRWDLPEPEDLATLSDGTNPGKPLIVLDPGHGGIDPGAQVQTESFAVDEKDLMLQFALELGEMLLRSGEFDVRLTRNDDSFVSLERRIALAHQAKADVFISLHADSLSEGHAHGSTVYTLSRDASDLASSKLAERHDKSDLLSGTDLSGADDVVTDVLLDLARQETHPRSEALSQALVDGLSNQGGPMNRRPLRSAGFSVLKSADIPSVLIEIGFMSSPRDLKNLMNAEWRRSASTGILKGLLAWQASDSARKPLVRQ